MAERRPRVDTENRTRLQDVIPLSTPLVLQVEPTNYCNLKCRFCPIGTMEMTRGIMTISQFEKIVTDIKEFDRPIKAMHLYGNGEPFFNPSLDTFIRIAKRSGRFGTIDITTNGLLMTKNKIDDVLDAGLDKISISVNGLSENQYYENCRTRINYKRFIKCLEYLYDVRGNCKVYIKSIAELYDDIQKKLFYDIFSPLADYIYLENMTNPWPDFQVQDASGKPAFSNNTVNKLVCPTIFYTMVVNWDGTVSLCCIDWNRKLVIGDVNTQSLKEIWESKELFYRQYIHLLGGRGKLPVCGSCNQINQCTQDNIDEYRDEILRNL